MQTITKNPSPSRLLFACFYLALTNHATHAQVPDAGSIINQLQRDIPRIDKLPEPESNESEPLIADQQGPKVKVNSLRFTGYEGLEHLNVLQDLTVDAIGQSLNFVQLQQLAERISRHLKAQGWLLANAYLPRQDVTEGNIEIAITQGKIEDDQQGQGIIIHTDDGVRLNEDTVRKRIRLIISDTGGLHKADLERALLLLNDLPGINARATLEKGSQPGTSRLGVDLKEGPLVNGSFSIDDFGNRYTGPWRGNLNANINDPFGLGDRLSLAGSGAENLGLGMANYSIPLGNHGLMVNAHYSHLTYSIGREFRNLDSSGTAQYTGGGFSYPFIRSRNFSLWGMADYTHKNLRNENLSILTSHVIINNGTIGLNSQSLDDFWGGGLTQASFTTVFGDVDLSEVADDLAIDRATANSHGRYQKFNFSLARLQKLSDRFSFYAAANGQLADRNLTSAEKFILGGPASVRAYAVGEGSGDSGWIANFELRYDIPFDTSLGNLQWVSFVDTGHVTLHEQRWPNDVISGSGRNEYSLSGAGIGLNWNKDNRYTIRTAWAHTIGYNPGKNSAGLDSDGKRDEDRFWLQAILYF